jgi:hypothetical protein
VETPSRIPPNRSLSSTLVDVLVSTLVDVESSSIVVGVDEPTVAPADDEVSTVAPVEAAPPMVAPVVSTVAPVSADDSTVALVEPAAVTDVEPSSSDDAQATPTTARAVTTAVNVPIIFFNIRSSYVDPYSQCPLPQVRRSSAHPQEILKPGRSSEPRVAHAISGANPLNLHAGFGGNLS